MTTCKGEGLREIRRGGLQSRGYRQTPDREYGAEVFDNVAVTPWFRVTADLQVISPALTERTTAVIFGLRAQIRL